MIQRKPFYFLRHAETEHNIRHLCAGGQTDSLLTATGIQQAKAISEKIVDLDYTHVISSPLLRTRHTATLATKGQVRITIDPFLREWDLGDHEEMPVPQFIEHTATLAPHTPLPNGESAMQFKARVLSALNTWLSHEDIQPLFVSHGLVYLTILECLNLSLPMMGNAQLVYFVPEPNGWSMSYI